MNFSFHNPTRLITGEECVQQNSSVLSELGKRCFIVTGKNSAVRSGALADLEKALAKEEIVFELYDGVEQNPMLENCHCAGEAARTFKADFVVGIGGGSPIDAAKAIAIYAANPMPAMDLYNYGWKNKALPIVAIGTTAGTGSEVGLFSVLTTPDGRKNSIGHVQCYPTISFGDPRYTWSLPLRFTVSTGLDALCHAIEGYFNVKANDMSDMYSTKAVQILYPALSALKKLSAVDEVPHTIREQLYYGSVVAGLTLAHSGTSYCHRLGYFLTEQQSVPHGTACAVFLPDFLRRSDRLLPEKSATMLKYSGITLNELCELIEQLNDFQPKKMTRDEIDLIVGRGVGSVNFTCAAPSGYTSEEAIKLMSDLFLPA